MKFIEIGDKLVLEISESEQETLEDWRSELAHGEYAAIFVPFDSLERAQEWMDGYMSETDLEWITVPDPDLPVLMCRADPVRCYIYKNHETVSILQALVRQRHCHFIRTSPKNILDGEKLT